LQFFVTTTALALILTTAVAGTAVGVAVCLFSLDFIFVPSEGETLSSQTQGQKPHQYAQPRPNAHAARVNLSSAATRRSTLLAPLATCSCVTRLLVELAIMVHTLPAPSDVLHQSGSWDKEWEGFEVVEDFVSAIEFQMIL